MTEILGVAPAQTVGPYLSIGLMRDLITPQRRRSGRPAGDPHPRHAHGRRRRAGAGRHDRDLAGERGRPLQRIRRTTGTTLALEEGFLGFGRSGTVDAGRFEFVTVKPGRVPWPDGGLQAPHLEVGVFARGLLKRAVTRMYFPDEVEANAADPVLSHLDETARATLVAVAEDGGLRFDIRLQGAGHTTFFAV